MDEMNYNDLKIKAKELGMEKVVGVSKEELIKFINASSADNDEKSELLNELCKMRDLTVGEENLTVDELKVLIEAEKQNVVDKESQDEQKSDGEINPNDISDSTQADSNSEIATLSSDDIVNGSLTINPGDIRIEASELDVLENPAPVKSMVSNISTDKDSIAKTRGFKNYSHAKSYLKSDDFKKLSKPDQIELETWFKNI